MPSLPPDFVDPPRDYSLAPFWFWNDDLDADEIRRQIDDFHDHGVYAFVLHPRVGLPRSLPFMGDALLGFMRIAVEHAKRRGMWVILYDEGMYPSGAASGLVVAENPAYACRGIVKRDVDGSGDLQLDGGHTLLALVERDTGPVAFIDRPIDSHIRGLHYADHDAPRDSAGATRFDLGQGYGPPVTDEDLPPAADLLNPDAVAAFIRIVYDGYADALGEFFGGTIRAVFTDEPMVMGRSPRHDSRPGTTGILEHVNRWFGRDISTDLPLLWEDSPESRRFKAQYNRAIKARLEVTYYQPLQRWCQRHGLALTGHPHEPDDLGLMRYFDWPGQDIVWHMIRPGDSALAGPQSTQAKAAASAKAHQQRKRNANEYLGAYGHQVDLGLVEWMTSWLIVRGCDLLIPHAFFYSIRGARIDECPPQLGPHGKLWDDFKPYADLCRRLCWLNGETTPVVSVAILAQPDHCPAAAAAVLFEHQIDFHYLSVDDLADADIDEHGISLAGFHYAAVVIDGIEPTTRATNALDQLQALGRVIDHAPEAASLTAQRLRELGIGDLRFTPHAPGLRVRHVRCHTHPEGVNEHWYLIFNEGEDDVSVSVHLPLSGDAVWIEPTTLDAQPFEQSVSVLIRSHELKLIRIAASDNAA